MNDEMDEFELLNWAVKNFPIGGKKSKPPVFEAVKDEEGNVLYWQVKEETDNES